MRDSSHVMPMCFSEIPDDLFEWAFLRLKSNENRIFQLLYQGGIYMTVSKPRLASNSAFWRYCSCDTTLHDYDLNPLLSHRVDVLSRCRDDAFIHHAFSLVSPI